MAAANPPPPSTTAPPSKSDPSHVTVTEKSPPESDHKEVPPSTTAPPPTSDPPQVTVTEQSPTELDHKEAPSPDPAADEVEKEAPPVPAPEPEPDESVKEAPPASTEAAREAEPPREEAAIVESAEKVKSDKKTFIQPAVSFKEESNLVADLSESERKALEELKKLVEEALKNRTLLSSTVEKEASTSEEKKQEGGSMEEVAIWGIPLLKDERSDVILLKFLRARDFKVNDSFMMLKNTLKWRREFGIDKLVEEDLGDDLEKVVFMHGHDREGHPVCYNVYGEFQNKELYAKTFSSEEKRARFLRWRIQFLEKSIRKLDFQPGGVCTIFQINDLKNAPGPGKRELRQATSQALHLLQDNYPEFVAKQVFINVPWWYVAFYTMMSPFMTQRTKSKFVFTRPPKTPTTLFKYISPEQVLIQYGGLSVDFCECDPEFTVADPATDINIKPTTKQFVEIICSEKCVIVWELRVVGWEVTYSAEFIPSAKDGYTVIIHKATKMASNDDPVVSGSFKVSEVGKIVLAVDNPTFKKRKLLYRYKVLPFSD